MIKYSVIIPTYNGSCTIRNTLYSLLRQSIDPKIFEIIVVSDGSADDTENVVKKFKIDNPGKNIIFLKKNNGGPASARNLGIKYARGSVIFFTDDDCEPEALWMEKILNIYKNNPEIVGIGGWYSPSLHILKTNIYNKFYQLYYYYIFGYGLDNFSGTSDEYTPFPGINTGNISFKKWIFKIVGTFDARFVPLALGHEDSEFCERIISSGFKLYYNPQLHVLHNKRMSLKKFIKLCINRSAGLKVYRQIRNIENTPLPSSISRFKQFKSTCRTLEMYYKGFFIEKRIILLAFIWFFLQNFLVHLPFFMRNRKNKFPGNF